LTLPPAPFLLRTLGPLVLERTGDAGSAAVVQRGGKPLALLAYLVVEGARPIPRALAAPEMAAVLPSRSIIRFSLCRASLESASCFREGTAEDAR
jgi:hypothetical protein